MNNSLSKSVSREEEIAFVVVEKVLGVTIEQADAGGGDKMPDGRWESGSRTAVVEVTSPPANVVMKRFAEAERAGAPFREAGSAPAHLGALADYLSDLVSKTLAKDVEKLNGVDADDRHLFLLARTAPEREYFARLSDTYAGGEREPVDNLSLPDGITDVWFQGRAQRGEDAQDSWTTWVARFNRKAGWTRHQVSVRERTLPGPSIVKDPVPDGWRQPGPRA